MLNIAEIVFRREILVLEEEAEKGICLACGEHSPAADDAIAICPECGQPALIPAKNLLELAERLAGCRKIR